MKKLFLCGLSLTMCVAMVGCGNSANKAAVTGLSNQLDEVSNTISSVQTINPTDLNLTRSMLDSSTSQTNKDSIYENVINTQQSLLNEEYYKMDILNKTSVLKNSLTKDLKLSKSQINAVKELTSNLTRYTNSVAYTKNEMGSAVKSITSMKKNIEKNADKINAKLNRLACNSNSRSAYYENILKTLDQISFYLNCEDCNNAHEDLQKEDDKVENENTQNKKNIDTYMPNNEETDCPDCNQNEIQNPNRLGNNEGISTPYPYNSNNFNRMYYGNYYGNNYGMPIGNGYGNPYYRTPYNMEYNRFNPTRNTDTYAPLTRNIDTYQFNRNGQTGVYGGFGYGEVANPIAPVTAEPEKRLEDFENMKEDNTIEKISSENILEDETENVSKKETLKPVMQLLGKSKRIQKELDQPIIAH